MVRSYLRWGPTQAFGIICSPGSNGLFDGKLAYVPGLEDILVWDVKKAQLLSMWHESGHRAEVTCIIRSPTQDTFAVGYADGSIRIWNARSGTVEVALNGHKRAVTALAYDKEGTRLASGSMDTALIIWDVVAETGLFRLRGHRDQITSIRFLQTPVSLDDPSTSDAVTVSTAFLPGYLVTTSKDTFLKLWDLNTQHCLQTTVAHRAEIWAMDINPAEDNIITGAGDGEIKAWKIDRAALSLGLREGEDGKIAKLILPLGNLPNSNNSRISQIAFHRSESYLAVQDQDKAVEVFRIRSEEEVRKKMARRKKRAKEKKKDKGKEADGNAGEVNMANDHTPDEPITLEDLYTRHILVRGSGKIRGFDFVPADASLKGDVQIFLSLASNAVEVWTIPSPAKLKLDSATEATRAYGLDLPGHRTDIRTLAISSDDELLASASNGALKIWNVKTLACIRTMDCGYAVCSIFLPDDRQVAVGTKSGEILLYDIASSSLIETIKAHEGTVWSIDLRPDGKALVSGSADKDVKFWDLEPVNPEGSTSSSRALVTLTHARTLKMSDDVLGACYSPNGKLIAVSLLDSTVKIFYEDSLKFLLSLYGHKLPVLSMAISSDSKLIVTCSADKNIKIWGLDFGDCHKSIFAHDESIMQVGFEPRTHNFWSVGKDKVLKYWDGDKFENIQKFEGHHAEIWALAVAHNGQFVVTGSHDKSIRIWEKTDEPLFLEEERERELEEMYERGIADSMNREDQQVNGDTEVAGAEATTVNKQTAETLMAGERIMEALDVADTERESWVQYEAATAALSEEQKEKVPRPTKHALLAALGDVEPAAYVLSVVEKIQTAALYDALLVLPFAKVVSLMHYLDDWAQREWNVALTSRILVFLLKLHHHQIVANRTMRTILIPLRIHLRAALKRQKEAIGYNLAAMRYIRRQDEATRTAELYEEGLDDETIKERIAAGQKRKRVGIRA
ncbi:WD40 repeat-like protein [Dacryopinax primogenitus]|uniref:WD40 repeat-like protein n=1 Tax=Dacryopinax primogenitus (strain DJM 731) TaxID=1858805 RepID=M5GGW3_DACPD|nr:WD40 repeat-like protein [Dacryopinax primogenitus]EJU06188.1 WD40 repeat-like protein [Dacryopinax primogenitus]